MHLLVTGGCGFIGSAFLRLVHAERPRWHLLNVDLLTYAGHPSTVAALDGSPRYTHVQADVADPQAMARVFAGRVDAVVHLAAESHVDRSILAPPAFIRTNVVGTQVLLDLARQHGIGRFVQVSTDEVYGSLGPVGRFTETSPLAPSSPYAASKASADLLALAWHRTWGLPVLVTRCSNNLGPFQFPEKLLPVAIRAALAGDPIPLYGTGQNVRDWIHVEDHARALLAVLEQGVPGRIYNVGAENERTNLDTARGVLRELGLPEDRLALVADRPGHDERYSIDPTRIREELGWHPRHAPAEALASTVRWYAENQPWCDRMLRRAAALPP